MFKHTLTLLIIIFTLTSCVSMDAAQRISNNIMDDIAAAGFREYDITAETNAHKATLIGYVSTEEEKRQAEEIALRQPEIKKVINKLEVKYTGIAHGEAGGSALMAEQLIAKINADHQIREFQIAAEPIGGKVKLTGTVGSYDDYLKLTNIIKSTAPGSVVNLVELRQKLSDYEINSIIRAHLEMIKYPQIQSSVSNGNLKLYGDAPTFEEVDRILSVVVNTPDLGEIDSKITVNGRPYPRDQFNIGF